jgi:hypothetical protein
MEAGAPAPAELARWVAERRERLSLLTADDGQAFDLSPTEARRLIAYAGFSLFQAGRALETESHRSIRADRRSRPTEVAV